LGNLTQEKEKEKEKNAKGKFQYFLIIIIILERLSSEFRKMNTKKSIEKSIRTF